MQVENLKIAKNVIKLIFFRSAGVGRTGTYIAVDIITHLISEQRNDIENMKLDVMGIVYQLRQDRARMVQTKVKYFAKMSIF
mgnify:FL=1